MKKTEKQFLELLNQQAQQQAKLQQRQFLPSNLHWLIAFVGKFPWQTLLVLSGISALVGELW